MRNMSFAITTEQIKNRTKTVTRRMGWKFLKPGDKICAVKKGMGLRKGEKIERLCVIEVVSNKPETLCKITREEVVKEGFPGMFKHEFVDMFCKSHKGCKPDSEINRIEFIYLSEHNKIHFDFWNNNPERFTPYFNE